MPASRSLVAALLVIAFAAAAAAQSSGVLTMYTASTACTGAKTTTTVKFPHCLTDGLQILSCNPRNGVWNSNHLLE